MATATNVHLDSVKDVGVYNFGVREDAARVTSKILQEDMESHHVFFNDEGFHSMFFQYKEAWLKGWHSISNKILQIISFMVF